MSLVVVARLHARPGKEDDLQEALSALAVASHGEEGCIGFALHRNVQDPLEFTTVEQWTAPEAIDSHFSTDHIEAVLARADELLSEPPDIRTYGPLPVGGAKGRL